MRKARKKAAASIVRRWKVWKEETDGRLSSATQKRRVEKADSEHLLIPSTVNPVIFLSSGVLQPFMPGILIQTATSWRNWSWASSFVVTGSCYSSSWHAQADMVSISASPEKFWHLGFCGRCQNSEEKSTQAWIPFCLVTFQTWGYFQISVGCSIGSLESRTFAEHSKNARTHSNANAIGFFHR